MGLILLQRISPEFQGGCVHAWKVPTLHNYERYIASSITGLNNVLIPIL